MITVIGVWFRLKSKVSQKYVEVMMLLIENGADTEVADAVRQPCRFSLLLKERISLVFLQCCLPIVFDRISFPQRYIC